MSDIEKECIISIKPSDKEDDLDANNTNNNNNDTSTSPVDMSIEDKLENTPPTTSNLSHIPNAYEILRKLEVIKEIKDKTMNLQRIRSKLTNEIEFIENGDKSLNESKTELDLLFQERVNLLEELRQIDSDISTLEKSIKQSEEEKRRAVETTKRLKLEYRPLKEQIGHLIESIGLNQSEDQEDDTLIENFLSKLGSDDTPTTTPPKYSLGIDRLLNDKPKVETNKHNEEPVSAFTSAIKSNTSLINHPFFLSQMDLPVQLATAALMAHSLRNNRPPTPTQMQHVSLPQQVQFNPFQTQQQQHHQQQFNQFILNQMNSNVTSTPSGGNNELSQTESPIQLQPPQFRQQPPPMKACLSCNQQIHRNAPICPLCKAKSRSRNPKKPKKSTKSNSPDSLSPDHKHISVKRTIDNL